jgi:hypothetical protein
MRITVDLPKDQIEALDAYAKSMGISRAAAVRESVSAYMPAKKVKRDINYWRNHPAVGSEKMPKGFDSVAYCRKLRAEWDRPTYEPGT